MGRVLAHHRERKACVYVRQSSLAQVRHHLESGRRQRDFRERALALGWSPENVEVIDEDQGLSGASAGGREGFKRLVAEVGLGEVGAVLGLEASRLARSCADWHRLLEIAAVTRTLIVDEEGVYDPNHYNDRLLLGLKGTISEAELHFLRQRMEGGRRNKARRGEYRIRLPAGYVWEEEEGIRKDPDERVRETIGWFFATFRRVGTAAAVVREFLAGRQPFPRRDGWGSLAAAVTWGRLSVSRAAMVLKNPIYAGIYVYDRTSEEEMDPEDPCAGGRIWIPSSHEAYLSEEEYEENVDRLRRNRNVFRGHRGSGSAREGSCLLTGIVLCGVCGRSMHPEYHSATTPVYVCQEVGTHQLCQRVHARHVDPLVEEVLVESLSSEELSLVVGAMEKVAERALELERQWQRRIEGARYEAERASRRYHRVEPENRLVARTLEKEWNDCLEELERVEQEYEEAKRRPPMTLTAEQKRRILTLAEDLPRLFGSPTTKVSQKKEVLRLLVEDVALKNVDEPHSIDVAIHWKTGVVSRHRAERPARHPQETAAETMERIRELYLAKTDEEVAQVLDAEGHRTGTGLPFTAGRVSSLRCDRGWTKRKRGGSAR